jgi:hypothetical protein
VYLAEGQHFDNDREEISQDLPIKRDLLLIFLKNRRKAGDQGRTSISVDLLKGLL